MRKGDTLCFSPNMEKRDRHLLNQKLASAHFPNEECPHDSYNTLLYIRR